MSAVKEADVGGAAAAETVHLTFLARACLANRSRILMARILFRDRHALAIAAVQAGCGGGGGVK